MGKKTAKEEMLDAIKERCKQDVVLLPEGNSTFQFTCKACGKCCFNRTGANSIILSPYDMFQILKHVPEPIDKNQFIKEHFVFHVGDSSALPIIYLNEKVKDGKNICVFLEKQENSYKCKIHTYKPSVCRMYPVGRATNNLGDFAYFLQKDTCGKTTKDSDTHTLDEWIPNRELSQKAFLEFSKFTTELYKVIPREVLLNLNEIVEPEVYVQIYNMFFDLLYLNYDYSKDFFSQFENNTSLVFKLFEKIAGLLKEN